MQLSEEQLAALLQLRRTLMAHIGALLAEREQIGTRIRVSTCSDPPASPCFGFLAPWSPTICPLLSPTSQAVCSIVGSSG